MARDTTDLDVATEQARQQDVMVADRQNGTQEVRITVRNDGYSPATIELEQNVPARLVFIQESTSRCAEQIQIPAFGVERTNLPEGQETVIEFTPDRTGEFAFVCGMDMLEGTILVRS
jgi:plastocyanin domain-containing protein